MVKTLLKNIAYPLLKSRPDFLVIGAQKAGTTSLYQYLIQHPDIVGNKSWKEIRYFDLPENYSQGMGWYLGHFPSKREKGDRLTFDASPSYLYFNNIPELIKKDLGDIKMIAILREPASRAYSAWQMYHSFADNEHDHLRAIADPRSFADAIDQELNGTPNHPTGYPYDYVDRGKYAKQLKNYYNCFDRDTLLVLSMDQLRQDMDGTLNQVCTFLEIPPFSQPTLDDFKVKKHNVGKYEKDPKDQALLDDLKTYFAPYNQELYALMNETYNW